MLTVLLALAWGVSASAAPLTFTQLTGVTGGSPAATGVWRADVSAAGIGTINSITIGDNSGGVGGAAGQFSGFDLDAIKLSYTMYATAADVAAAAGLSVFDFTGGTIFAPGTQRAPADSKLFGTGAAGNTVDNAVATLGLFDGNATTAIPGAFGFISLGDNGQLSFNLTSGVSTTGLYLYIGEVGDNGEIASGNITVSGERVPDPGSSLLLLSIGLAGLGAWRKRQR